MATRVPPNNAKCVYVVEGYVAYEESTILAVCSDYRTCRAYIEMYKHDHPDHDYDGIVFSKVEWVEAATS